MTSTAVTSKGAATRAFLLQTAAEVFAERGYTETRMSELIARSGLTKGAFYFHFTSKEQLALAVIAKKQQQTVERIQAAIEDGHRAIDQLRQVAVALVQAHRDDPSTFSVSRLTRDLARLPDINDLVQEHSRAWVNMLAGVIANAQTEGDLPRSIEAADLAVLLVAATDGLKDLGALIDSPNQEARAFERRMQGLVTLVDALATTKR
jgi:AcrR family transcriptional regulator